MTTHVTDWTVLATLCATLLASAALALTNEASHAVYVCYAAMGSVFPACCMRSPFPVRKHTASRCFRIAFPSLLGLREIPGFHALAVALELGVLLCVGLDGAFHGSP